MLKFTEEALRENANIALFEIIYGVEQSVFFDASYVVLRLREFGHTMTEYEVEAELRDMAMFGRLNREGGLYCVDSSF